MSGASLAPSANFTLIAYAAKLTAASFLILISEPLATGFTVAVICASNEKAHASNATEITVFIPILPADLPEIAPFYLQETTPETPEIRGCLPRALQHYRFAMLQFRAPSL